MIFGIRKSNNEVTTRVNGGAIIGEVKIILNFDYEDLYLRLLYLLS